MKIRRIEEKDAGDLYEVLSDPEVMKYIEPPYTMEQVEQFMTKVALCDEPGIFAAENESGDFVGYVIFHTYDEECMEIGWLLKKKHWGKGYALELTRQLVEETRLLHKKAVIECVPEQQITRHIALKAGFSFQGIEDGLCVFLKEFQ